jgi:hypothetical protein
MSEHATSLNTVYSSFIEDLTHGVVDAATPEEELESFRGAVRDLLARHITPYINQIQATSAAPRTTRGRATAAKLTKTGGKKPINGYTMFVRHLSANIQDYASQLETAPEGMAIFHKASYVWKQLDEEAKNAFKTLAVAENESRAANAAEAPAPTNINMGAGPASAGPGAPKNKAKSATRKPTAYTMFQRHFSAVKNGPDNTDEKEYFIRILAENGNKTPTAQSKIWAVMSAEEKAAFQAQADNAASLGTRAHMPVAAPVSEIVANHDA